MADKADSLVFATTVRRTQEPGDAPAPDLRPHPRRLGVDGRFVLHERLGAGAMGVVFRAFDEQLGIQVALKRLKRASPFDLALLKQEFRTARDILHPNLVRLHDLVVEDGQAFFTMELLEGEPLRRWVWGGNEPPMPAEPSPSGPLRARLDGPSRSRLRIVAEGLSAGLEALHSRGIVHRDVKPENILVCGGRPVLLDFGVAQAIGPLSEPSATFAGTPRYMAPELFSGARPTPANDAFSLGVLLYELLTGVFPYPDGCFFHPDSEHDFPSIVSDPEDQRLVEQVLALLVIDPARRARVSPRGLRGHISRSPSQIPLVGRDAELDTLKEAVCGCFRDRHARRIDVLGPSGYGKTRLVRDFCQAVAQEACVLSGTCHIQEALPYKGLDTVALALANRLPHAREHLDPLRVLVAAFPDVQLVRSAPSAEAFVPPRRQEVVAAFGSLIRRLAEQKPVILWLDDAQWGGADAAAFVDALLERPEGLPLAVILSHRGGEEAGPLLDALRAVPVARTVELGTLTRKAAQSLLREVVPEGHLASDPDKTIDRLGASPYALIEVGGWLSGQVEPVDDPLGSMLRGRLERLGPAAQRLLEVAALAGLPLQRDLLLEAAEVDRELGAWLVDELCRLRLLARAHEKAHVVDVYHDRVRQAVLEHIGEARRIELHGRIADSATSMEGPPALSALHLAAAGRVEESIPPAVRAAEEATANLSHHQAARMYDLAIRSAEEVGAPVGALLEPWAKALARSGEGDAAVRILLRLADEQPDTVRFLRRAAELLLGRGHLVKGRAVLDRLRARVGLRPIGSRVLRFIGLIYWAFRLRRRGLEPSSGAFRSAELRDRMDALWTQATVFTFYEPGGGAVAQHLVMALDSGDPDRILRALCIEYTGSALVAPHGRWTEQLLHRARAAAKDARDPECLAFYALARGYAAFLRGEFETSNEALMEACQRYATLRATGWAPNVARAHVIYTQLVLGAVRHAKDRAEPFIRELDETGEIGMRAYFDSHFGYQLALADDDPGRARALLTAAESSVAAGSFQYAVLAGRAATALFQGRPDEALAATRSAFLTRVESRLIQVARITTRWLHGLSLIALGRRLGRVERLAQAIENERCPWAGGMVSAFRASVAAQRGETGRALALMDQAIRDFESARLNLYALSNRLRRAELAGDPEARRVALEEMERLGLRNPSRWASHQAPLLCPLPAAGTTKGGWQA